MSNLETLWNSTAALPVLTGEGAASLDDQLRAPAALALLRPFAIAAASSSLDAQQLEAVHFSLPSDLTETLEVARVSLLAFVQINWTGPELGLSAVELLAIASERTIDPSLLQSSVTDALTRGGEPAYHLAQDSFFLYFSLRLLHQLAATLTPGQELTHLVTWWRLRGANVLNRVLDSAVSIPDDLHHALSITSSWFDQTIASTQGPAQRRWQDIAARYGLEQGLLSQKLGQTNDAEDKFEAAAAQDGLVYHLTGALGKRTKWQKEAKTQLLLLARSRDDALTEEQASRPAEEVPATKQDTYRDEVTSGFNAAPAENQDVRMPARYNLNDDTLLEQTEFTTNGETDRGDIPVALRGVDPNAQERLTPFDQSILLSLAMNMQNSSADALLTSEQMGAYVDRVLLHPMNWSVYTMGLLLRSRLEATRTRTVERSVLQLQALLDQMATAESPTAERLRLFFSLDLPPRWGLQAELAQRYLSIGSIRSALEIYSMLQMWEEVARCLQLLSRDQEATELVRDLLSGKKVEADEVLGRRRIEAQTAAPLQHIGAPRAAKLWCLLGDLEPDEAECHYKEAWSVSLERSARAARSLAGLAFRQSDFGGAITWFSRALALNPLYSKAWFVLGCAYMRQEQFGNAVAAFRRSTALDEEDADAWNNLASCYLQLDTPAASAMLQGKTQVDALPGNRKESRPDDDSDDEEEAISPALSRAGKMKKLAHKALSHALTHKRDSWRVWTNYLVVSIDVGDFLEAAHALGRVVEIRAAGGGADGPGPNDDKARGASERAELAIDFSSLQRLVGAAVRAGQSAVTEAQQARADGPGSQAATTAAASAAHARTLLRSVFTLFDSVLLPRVSDSMQLWQLYARLLMFQGSNRACILAHLRAWRASAPYEAAHDSVLDLPLIKAGTELLTETVEVMENLSLRPAEAAPTIALDRPDLPSSDKELVDATPAMKDWKFKARSLVREFAAHATDYEDTEDYDTLIELRNSLK